MSVFVTVGLETYPFDRLVSAVDDAVAVGAMPSETFIQFGRAARAPVAAQGSDYLGPAEMLKRIRDAEVVIAHAGVGTFLQCHEAGRIPLLVPRRHSLGEHVDDHQEAFALEVEKLGMAIVVQESDAIAAAVAEYRVRIAGLDLHAGESHSTPQLIAHLAELIDGHPGVV